MSVYPLFTGIKGNQMNWRERTSLMETGSGCMTGPCGASQRPHGMARLSSLLLASVVLIGPASAQTDTALGQGSAAATFSAATPGFSMTLDGAPVESRDGRLVVTPENGAMAADGALVTGSIAKDAGRLVPSTPGPVTLPAAIEVRYDGLDVKPVLNVTTIEERHAFATGETIRFVAGTNYPGFIARAEIRIVAGSGQESGRTIAVLPVDWHGQGSWTMPEAGEPGGDADRFTYALRVFDHKDRHDETTPLPLVRKASDPVPAGGTASEAEIAASRAPRPGSGEDRTARRAIPVHGGAVTVIGRAVPDGHDVFVMGEPVAVDDKAGFVIQRILPPGEHEVDVVIGADRPDETTLIRPVHIPANDWFLVGLADLTLHQRMGGEDWQTATGDKGQGLEATGRLAFYLKGRIRGRYLLTAAADTGEDEVSRLFRNLGGRDAKALLRRIDPDAWYPVYGDDSEAVDDAPTSGKFYVRLERGTSHVMWGDFKAAMTGRGLVRSERKLYGAQAVYHSEAATGFGEPRLAATAHAAQAGTMPRRDLFRGTGGSSYFLSRQDIETGSETVTVIVTDPDSGRVLERRLLARGADYDIDYVQGIVLLRAPLASGAAASGLVRDHALGTDALTLSVQYEHPTTLVDTGAWSYGGRAEGWLTDHVQIGVAGQDDASGLGDRHRLAGVDARLRISENSWLEAAYARSRGAGVAQTYSLDGGLTDSLDPVLAAPVSGEALTIRGELDLADWGIGLEGRLGGHFERRSAGFADLDRYQAVGQDSYGAYGEITITPDLRVRLAHDHVHDDAGHHKSTTELAVTQRIDDAWSLEAGLAETQRVTGTDPGDEDGRRLDAAARLTWSPNPDTAFYGFVQGTVDRSGTIDRNDRYGLGGAWRLTDRLSVDGEVSGGTTGTGARAGITYAPTADDRYYLAYELDPERTIAGTSLASAGRDFGGLTLGVNKRYDETLSAHAERRFDMADHRRQLSSVYGLTWTPDTAWTWTGGIETGLVTDALGGDTRREAFSLGVTYKDEDQLAWRLKGEFRHDRGVDPATGDRSASTAYLLLGGIQVRLSDDWRLLGDLDAVIARSPAAETAFGDRHYVEASLGFAYRPVAHDRLNVLGRFSYLEDLYALGDAPISGEAIRPMQKSGLFSLDATYQVTPKLTLGAKYGFRFGEVAMPVSTGSDTAAFGDFVASSAHLGVVRADYHVVRNWDVLLEGRALWLPDAGTVRYGALASVARHVGDNMKLGVGYNFGHFSDDLADLVADDHGFFVNVTGKF